MSVDFNEAVVKSLELRAQWLETTINGAVRPVLSPCFVSPSYYLPWSLQHRVYASILAPLASTSLGWNPAGEVLCKTLTLLFGELGELEGLRSKGDEVFEIYAVVGRLVRVWEVLCPGYVSLLAPSVDRRRRG